MTDGNTIILYVPKDKVLFTEDRCIVDTGLTTEELLLMFSGAFCNPGKGVMLKEDKR